MKCLLLSSFAILFVVQFSRISAKSNHRIERQASNYEFPGASSSASASASARKAQYEELIDQYEPVARVAAAQTYSPSVADPQDYSAQYTPASYRGSSAGSRSRTPNRNAKDEDEARRLAEEEEEKKPDRLALLLQDSKFACDNKKDGYYADESVGCQVFHYCVAGAKHSWQCPENTVFHQIHLNCVPAAQDICKESSKFHIVNDYLYKPLEQRGPNNTVRYHQRYYPEGFDFGGDTLSQVLPPSRPQRPQSSQPSRDSYDSYDDSYEPRGNSRSQADDYSSYQSYPAPAPVRSQPVSRPVSRAQPVRSSVPQTYSAPSYTTAAQPKPTARPITYSTPSLYSSSYSDDSDNNDYYPSSGSNYPSSGSSYTARDTNDYSSAANSYSPTSNSYSAPSSSYSAPSSSSYPSSAASYSGALPSSSYPSSSSSSSSSGSSATLASYRPVQSVQSAKPVSTSYPSRSIGIPIASFRVAAAPSSSYGASAQASRVQASAYPSSSSGFSLGAFNSEMASGVKYDEEY